jgi:hypothetical protein
MNASLVATCPAGVPFDLRGSRQSDSNRRPADYESVAFLEGRYLGHDILAEK